MKKVALKTIENKTLRDCLAAVPPEQKAEFDLSFGIAERLSEIMKEKNLSQKDLAHLLNKRESEISKWADLKTQLYHANYCPHSSCFALRLD